MRANILRSGVVVPNSGTIMGGAYVRGQANAQTGISSGTTTLLLGVGDTLTFQMREEGNTANTYTFGGADSVVEIIEIPSQVIGVQGPPGADGTGLGTNLSIASRGADTLDVASSTGTDATIPAATDAATGLQNRS